MVDLQCCVCFQCTAKKDGAGGIRLPDFRLYDKVTNQNIMLLTHTHAHTHTHTQTPEIDTSGTGRKPRNKPMLLSLINLQQRRQRYNGEKAFSLISAGKTGQLHTKE